LIRAQRSS